MGHIERDGALSGGVRRNVGASDSFVTGPGLALGLALAEPRIALDVREA